MNPAPAPAACNAPSPYHPASSPDFVPRELLRGLQSERLRRVVGQVYEHVPMYRQRMQKHALTPAEIHGIDDLAKLPLTTEADLRDAYPTGMFAALPQQIARLHATGTKGAVPFSLGRKLGQSPAVGQSPIVVAYTRRDLEVWTEVVVRALACCGVHQGDTILNACGYDLFADALGLHYGAERLGVTVVPVFGSDAGRHIAMLKDFGVSTICCTPTYFLSLVERAERLGVRVRDLALRAGIFVGEAWSEALRQRIEEAAGIRAYNLYGLPEAIGPGMGAECTCRNGLHLFEDHFYPEVIEPASGEPLPDGREGELVLTTLSKEAMLLIRYRTGDLTTIAAEPCPCGRTVRRIARIARRSDDRIVIQGVGVYPAEIEAALLAVEGTLPQYQIVLTREKGLDQVEVQVEVTSRDFSDRVGEVEALQGRFARAIERALGIGVAVRLVEPHAIDRNAAQGRRVIDKRGALP
jgi:phenylacetate-CoA ligase